MRYPHGMILVTGPTGSGKTTTLYAALNILNREQVHIATIEDPVEYAIAGVSQIQVNPKTKLTFAEGLRAIVRQDPDIIMVGEIRDDETAGIAVNSALTGHLVLSTLHTNDAATALPRLTDMKVEPFLIASTVNMIIAQRLVRLSCHKCRASSALSAEELMLIKNEPNCPVCGNNPTITELIDYEQFCGLGLGQEAPDTDTTGVQEISAKDFKALVDKNGKSLNIIDVREPYEYDISRIQGAKLIPLGTLMDHVNELDSSKEYIIHCRSGARSAKAIQQLQKLGFRKLKNLAGGINAYADLDPRIPKY
jgi:rhodanese-related sulfurtransferase